jgi:L-iditol 2-dehydrogenase
MAEKMKAQVFYEKEKMTLEELTVPEVGPDEVLVKVKDVGICGSDISYYFGMSPLGTESGKGPLVLGHEFTGIVAKVGAIAASQNLFKEGDRVVVNPVQHCNACPNCAEGKTHICQNLNVPGVTANGAFAEYTVSKYTGLFKLPDNISLQAGAMIEPLACAVNGMNRLDIQPGQFVTVIGPGAIGMMMVQLARAYGAGKVALIGTRDYRLEHGKKYGADYLFNTKDEKSPYYAKDVKEAVRDVTNGRLADRVIVPAGPDAAFEQGVDIAGETGIIVQFGLPDEGSYFKIPSLEFHTMDKEIRSAWLAPMVWPQTIRLVQEGLVELDSLVTHTRPLEETGQAIQDLRNRVDEPMKVEIEM